MKKSVIIVGAGPAGLSTAYWLSQQHIDFLILEKASVGWSWQSHYDSLRLHTLKGVSALPGKPMPADYPAFPTRAQVAEYLEGYAAALDFPIQDNTAVLDATFSDNRWKLQSSRGEFQADVLALTTGIWSTPVTPPFPDLDRFEGRVIHSAVYKNNQPFKGERVLVIGAGNSGSELAVEISQVAAHTAVVAKDGTTFVDYPTSDRAVKVGAWLFSRLPDGIGHRLLARSRRKFDHLNLVWPDRPLPQVYPVVGYELPDAVERGDIEVFPIGIERFTPEGVVFEDGRVEAFDAIVMATGYRPTLGFIRPEDLPLDPRGWPRLNASYQSITNERLFAVGYTYPNTEGWFQSIPRVSKRAARAIARLV